MLAPSTFLSLVKEEIVETSMETNNENLAVPRPQTVCHPAPDSTDPKNHRVTLPTLNSNNMQPPNPMRKDVEPNFEPIPRGRCNTWPLLPEGFLESEDASTVDLNHSEPPRIPSGSSLVEPNACVPKKNTSRRNPWGNMSYADLIAQAIISSPEGRATLSQIYDWMVQNVPYFKDKGDSNSSAGWKNSIRHNLSLHNRFMRMQNEGTGKSSWWVLNPDAKPGKSTRRRANTLEGSRLEKKRGRVKKKVEGLRSSIEPPPSPSLEGGEYFPTSPSAAGLHHPFQLSPQDYRPRASSNASSCGRLSPIPAMDSDMHDTQVPPISPGVAGWGPDYWSSNHGHPPHMPRHILEHYAADNLVDSIGEGLKLGQREPWGSHPVMAINNVSGECVTVPHHQHSQHYINGFINHNIPRQVYGSYEDYNGYMPPNAHGVPFHPHSKDKHRRPHIVPPHLSSLQPIPSNPNSQNISPPNAYGENRFPPSCEQEMRHTSSFSSPPPLAHNNNNNSPSANHYATPTAEPKSSAGVSDGEKTPTTSSCSVPTSSQQQEPNISESTTMLRVALSHREASSCLMNGSPHYRHGVGPHHTLHHGAHGSSDFVEFDTIQGGLDCNVEEVIKHELQYEDDLNFDLEQGQNIAYPYSLPYAHRESAGPQIGGVPVPVYSCSSIPSGNHWVR